MGILSDKAVLKLPAKDQIFFIQRGQLIFADDGCQRPRIAHLGIAGKQLVCHCLVIRTGVAFADAVLHQTRQARQHVDRRVNRLTV